MVRSRRRRIAWFVAIIAAPIVLPVFYVGSLLLLIYLHASETIEIDGPVEKGLELYYWPLAQFANSDLPGANALNGLVELVAEAGERRRAKIEMRWVD